MNYSDLVKKLADELDLSQAETKRLIRDVTDILTENLGNGKGISIPDLGTFTVRTKDPRKVYNPHYKKYILTNPKRVVEFTPASNLKENLKYVRPQNE
ncbi:MAG: HU family DNA-binding protein [Balneolaceae bacterium]